MYDEQRYLETGAVLFESIISSKPEKKIIMSKLTRELLLEHAHISDALLKALNIGIHTAEGKKCLFLAKDDLLAHLEREDRELYPALWKAAESDKNLKNVLHKYARNMDNISATALAFFDKYCSADAEEGFEGECKALIRVLCKRIRHEEAVLYKKYDAIMG